MMQRRDCLAAILVTLVLAQAPALAAAADEEAALAKALPSAKVSLRQGLAAASSKGRPVSGKFELDDGKLQLSIYTVKAGKFLEVIVDYGSGRVTKAETISAGDDLVAAKAQADVLAGVKEPLSVAIEKAEKDATGYRAVSVTPENAGNGKVATVTLAKGDTYKTVAVAIK